MIDRIYNAAITNFSRAVFYDLVLALSVTTSAIFLYNVWMAETKRVVPARGKIMTYKVREENDPAQFAMCKSNAWERLTLFSAISALLFTFRKDAHEFLAD
jgi:hypothetical protein